jgi:hypothetical protein
MPVIPSLCRYSIRGKTSMAGASFRRALFGVRRRESL